jgi:methylmalonyl-CoA/ethylmalonyl-CoA epimerase
MIGRIDHVSLAVKDFEKARDFLCRVLGAIPCSWSVDDEDGYLWYIFALGDLSRIELLTPTAEGSFLERFLEGREGVHHITLHTTDIVRARQVLEENGIPYFGYSAYPGATWKELFIHPRDAFGVLIQIAEFTPDAFIADSLRLGSGRRWSVERAGGSVRLTLAHPGGGTVKVDLAEEEAERLAGDLAGANKEKTRGL